MAQIEFASVQKIYNDGTQAVFDLDLAIEDGELMVLVGPSGCGKTTALRMVAGLEEITDGEIRIGDRHRQRPDAEGTQHRDGLPELRALSAHDRRRQPRLQPQAAQDAEEGGRRARPEAPPASSRSRTSCSASRARSRAASASASRWAGRSSASPQAFLMDEPLSNLDAKLRVQMRAEIHQLQRRLGVTTMYVTHDQVEAMTMGDRVAVMNARAPAAGRHPAGALRQARQRVRRRLHRLSLDQPASRQRWSRATGTSPSPSATIA